MHGPAQSKRAQTPMLSPATYGHAAIGTPLPGVGEAFELESKKMLLRPESMEGAKSPKATKCIRPLPHRQRLEDLSVDVPPFTLPSAFDVFLTDVPPLSSSSFPRHPLLSQSCPSTTERPSSPDTSRFSPIDCDSCALVHHTVSARFKQI